MANNISTLGRYTKALALVLLMALWQGSTMIEDKLNDLPIKQVPRAPDHTDQVLVSNIYPVWVKQALKAPQVIATNSAPPVSIADAFADKNALLEEKEKEKAKVKVKPVDPDFVSIFKSKFAISGISNDGVYANDTFYPQGARLTDFSMDSPVTGKSVVPVIRKITSNTVSFDIGLKKLDFVFDK